MYAGRREARPKVGDRVGVEGHSWVREADGQLSGGQLGSRWVRTIAGRCSLGRGDERSLGGEGGGLGRAGSLEALKTLEAFQAFQVGEDDLVGAAAGIAAR
jgi:hypothetical protein